MDSLSYLDYQENDKFKSKSTTSNLKSHRKTTSALLKNAEAALTPIKSTSAFTSSTTPIKSFATTDNVNTNSATKVTTLSPKSSRYTIAFTPTKTTTYTAGPATSTMLSVSSYQQSTASPMAPQATSGKSFFSTPIKGDKKLKKKQLEKEYQLMQDKMRIMEKIRVDNDSDIERMKVSLIDTLTDNDRLQRRVSELEEMIEAMKSELGKGSYNAWKGYCSLQDSPPGVSTRNNKKRTINASISTDNC
ncbi:hypothetical protein SAMD00019534_040620 [Acytostelium subglobosum LB1]|uniref:hypothetical protein n=1 Tax=Acytostelium subglobosum LB1 TaxID=1410327 RepID=UPI00064521C7|nr:hypothetical protein SAMD00019534_040620 [Acytostelium subglobosum LB1]GAM20887.1 hypothetical protein SAMD00019534_040620 [Acytostelium subglobosum LB1]|eukprot:XP_012756021.1 hypothetical protein SAMD00019534_040620 [Acytostelium subglobosum LB1]